MALLQFASGIESNAFGKNTEASGDRSTAIGQFTQAIGQASTATGANSIASGQFSTAIGYGSTEEYVPGESTPFYRNEALGIILYWEIEINLLG